MALQRLSVTASAIRAVFTRPRPLLVTIAVSLAYLLGYLYAIGDLSIRRGIGVGIDMPIEEPLVRMLERTGPASFEAIAFIDLEPFRLLFSPLNTLLGIGLAALVGVNIALSYLAITQPRACDIGAGSGVLASIPALLSGSACCAPVVLIVLGIQASGLLLTVMTWLLPIGIILLVGSLVYLGGKIDPTL